MRSWLPSSNITGEYFAKWIHCNTNRALKYSFIGIICGSVFLWHNCMRNNHCIVPLCICYSNIRNLENWINILSMSVRYGTERSLFREFGIQAWDFFRVFTALPNLLWHPAPTRTKLLKFCRLCLQHEQHQEKATQRLNVGFPFRFLFHRHSLTSLLMMV